MSALRDLGYLFSTEGPRLRRFLRRFGPSVSAEDIAQDSFARLCAAEPGSVTSPRAYLFRIARNLAINEVKRQATAPVRTVDPFELDASSPEPNPEERRVLAEDISGLALALAGLPQRNRQALILFKVEGYSYKEVGQRLGVSPRTVERYVADAIAHCHKELRLRASEE